MKAIVLVTVALLALPQAAPPRAAVEADVDAKLRRLFPGAIGFSPKQGAVPHYKAFAADNGNSPAVIGYAFWADELTPLERGYDGPIAVLVGLDLNAKLTGIVVGDHDEPYGYFSIDTKQFQQQFKGKDIRDDFKVGLDIDGISRATISVTTVSRSVRNSARRIARALLTPPKN